MLPRRGVQSTVHLVQFNGELTSPSESVAIERAGPFWVICAEADLRFFQTVKY